MINPVNHATSPEADRDVQSRAVRGRGRRLCGSPHTGRGGWTWYTGLGRLDGGLRFRCRMAGLGKGNSAWFVVPTMVFTVLPLGAGCGRSPPREQGWWARSIRFAPFLGGCRARASAVDGVPGLGRRARRSELRAGANMAAEATYAYRPRMLHEFLIGKRSELPRRAASRRDRCPSRPAAVNCSASRGGETGWSRNGGTPCSTIGTCAGANRLDILCRQCLISSARWLVKNSESIRKACRSGVRGLPVGRRLPRRCRGPGVLQVDTAIEPVLVRQALTRRPPAGLQ